MTTERHSATMTPPIDGLTLVSVDDHLVEPPDLFDGLLPASLADRAPRVTRTEAGADVWVFEGQEIPNIGLNAVAGRPPEEYGVEPTAFDELRPGTYDVDRRVDDMNANGVLASMCFPSFPQFCGQVFAKTADRDLGLAVLRAYNDWHIDRWCGAHPGRFIPLAVMPLWDPDRMADEVHRVAAKGCHAVTFSENPEKLGLPSFHDDHWDPFWTACADLGTVVCLHLGSSSEVVITSLASPVTTMISLQPMNLIQAAADLLWSRVVRQFPVRIALSEGGIGWIPYFLERCDYVYERHHRWTGSDFGGRLPSEVFRERFITCFISDQVGVEQRERIGVETICWESDYPHSDSTWPESPERLAPCLAGLSQQEVSAITHENALRLFQFDPFRHRGRSACTVGALRALADGVDTTVASPAPDFVPPVEPVTLLRLMEDAQGVLDAAGRVGDPQATT
jgi:predicted TIM-barrel fold metal-dependent hydrolase